MKKPNTRLNHNGHKGTKKGVGEKNNPRRFKTKGCIFLELFLVPFVSLWFNPVFSFAQETQPQGLTLGQVLRLAEKTSPSLKAVLSRENEAKEFSREADSGFYPDLGLVASTSNGFPASPSGFGTSGLYSFPGLAGSPYRQGPAADAYAKWDLLDLSNWHQSSAAHYEYDASRERTKYEAELVDAQALEAYLEAVRLKGDRDAWKALADELTGIRDTVNRFVRNGQYSQVQGYLIEDQLADASLKAGDFNRQYQASLERLALLTGLEAPNLSCPSPADLSEESLAGLQAPGMSPLVTGAEMEAKSAKETEARYSAENLPVLEVAGSAGYLNDTRLVQAQDYSVFVGISLPLFEGFRIDAEEKAARSEAEARQAEVSKDQLALDDLNVRYKEQIEEAREDLATLLGEQERAQKAVALARQRYLAFLGPLSDLQQALKDMVNVDIQTAETKTRLLLASGERYLFNGGTVEAIK